MFREPKDGKAELVAVNESLKAIELKYTVTALSSGKVVGSGNAQLEANSNALVLSTAAMDTESFEIYLIEWQTADGVSGKNHYTCGTVPFDINKYKELMSKTDILRTEGF